MLNVTTRTKATMKTIMMYMKTIIMTTTLTMAMIMLHLVRQAVRQQQDLCIQRSPGQGKDTFMNIGCHWKCQGKQVKLNHEI